MLDGWIDGWMDGIAQWHIKHDKICKLAHNNLWATKPLNNEGVLRDTTVYPSFVISNPYVVKYIVYTTLLRYNDNNYDQPPCNDW